MPQISKPSRPFHTSAVLAAATLTLGLIAWGLCIRSAHAQTTPDAVAQTGEAVTAAKAFVDSLNAGQREKMLLAFTPDKQSRLARFTPSGAPGMPPKGPPGGFIGEQYGLAVWSNYPVSDVPRPGAQLGSLSTQQRAAAMHLMQTVLSARGYQKMLDVMGSDQALSVGERHFAAGEAVYTIALFGTPSTDTPWMLQFGGHHLAINLVVAGARGVLTPTMTGAQPAVYHSRGRTVRVLAAENDKAFALLAALKPEQRQQAVLNYKVEDLVLGPGHAGETIVPEGLKGSDMDPRQKALLLDVISEWAEIVNTAYAAPRLREIASDLDNTWFAWSGPTIHRPNRNGSAYYRIQGPRVHIEFSPQRVGGDATMHVHTVYRDPTNDYGIQLTKP